MVYLDAAERFAATASLIFWAEARASASAFWTEVWKD